MRESLLSESPVRQNLVPKAFGAGFEFLRYFQVLNEELPAADEIFAPTKVLSAPADSLRRTTKLLLPSYPPAILSEWTIWDKHPDVVFVRFDEV